MNNVTGKVNGIKTDMIVDENEDFESVDEYYDDELDYGSDQYSDYDYDSESEYKNEDTDYMPEEDSDNNYQSSNNNIDDLKKKMIKLMIIIGAVVLLLLLILFIVSLLGNKSYSHEEIESVMKESAQNYFTEHKDALPTEEDQTVEIEASTLASGGYMKDLSEYSKETCSGKVQVRKSGSAYIYIPYLDCGSSYSTKFLVDEVANDSKLVGSGYGLYNINDSYVFRGETVNNYLKMEAASWRIVKVNSDKTITIILDEEVGIGNSYDNRYNKDTDMNSGYNSYLSSRIKEKLDEIYDISDPKNQFYILSEKDKANLVTFDLCIGKRSVKDTDNSNAIECMQTTQQKIGLLTASDFANGSIDTNCKAPTDESCKNYNYLGHFNEYWLGTACKENSYSAFYVASGRVNTTEAMALNNVRPIVTLSANTLIKGGTGTEEDPYIIK